MNNIDKVNPNVPKNVINSIYIVVMAIIHT